MYTGMNEGKKSIENSSSLCQTYTANYHFETLSQKWTLYRRQVVHPRPQAQQGGSVAQFGTLP